MIVYMYIYINNQINQMKVISYLSGKDLIIKFKENLQKIEHQLTDCHLKIF